MQVAHGLAERAGPLDDPMYRQRGEDISTQTIEVDDSLTYAKW